MTPSEFLELTPQEINWKIEAYNEKARARQLDVWNAAMLIAIGFNDPKKFPSFDKFCPGRAKSKFLEKAMKKARELGDI